MNIKLAKRRLDIFMIEKSYGLCNLFENNFLNINSITNLVKNRNAFAWSFDVFLKEIFLTKNDKEAIFVDNVDKFISYVQENFEKESNFIKNIVSSYCAYCIISEKLYNNSSFEDKELTIENLNSFSSSLYYRGQSESKWGIVPSMFRNYKFLNDYSDGDVVTLESLYNIYNEHSLVEKANQTIFYENPISKETLSYEFVSFMQHAVSYSPLIDFSSNIHVASYFALSNRNIFNDYSKIDSRVFAFRVNNEISSIKEIDEFLKKDDFKVYVLNGKIPLGEDCELFDKKGRKYTLSFKSIDSISNILTPKYKAINIPTSDRMKYQQGKFILFYDYLLVNDRILFQLCPNLKVDSYIIKGNKKKEFYNYLSRDKEYYSMNLMMNPYDYFLK